MSTMMKNLTSLKHFFVIELIKCKWITVTNDGNSPGRRLKLHSVGDIESSLLEPKNEMNMTENLVAATVVEWLLRLQEIID